MVIGLYLFASAHPDHLRISSSDIEFLNPFILYFDKQISSNSDKSMRTRLKVILSISLHVYSRNFKIFSCDARGATAVEFGILVVPFMLTLLGVFELGYTFYMMTALDSATRNSARAVMIGAVSTAGMNASTFRSSVVCPRLPSNFDCASVFINMTVVPAGTSPTGYYSYVNSTQSALLVPSLDTAANKFCPGSGGQYVVLQLLYPANILTQLFASRATTVYQGRKVNVLMSTATFRAEPYSGATTYAGC